MDQLIFRREDFKELKAFIDKTDQKNIFLVRGKGSYEHSGAKTFIEEILGLNSINSFSEFDKNPQLYDLKNGLDIFQSNDYDLIIAIGGGSVLDMAKLISVMSHQSNTAEDIVQDTSLISKIKTPVLCIPTTSGTGAEATTFAVLYVDKVKYSIAHEYILPDYVFLSPEFTFSADPYLTACTGLDAFCQAVESVWSVNSNKESEKFALEAVKLIWNKLPDAVNKNDKDAKYHMSDAAFLAGKAINISKTTAPHALSYAFTSYYNIPHGHAVALSLPFFFQFNYYVSEANCNDKRGTQHVRERMRKILKILNTDIENIKLILNDFFNSIKINIDISSLIQNFDKEIIINNVNFERLKNNPAEVGKNSIEQFLS